MIDTRDIPPVNSIWPPRPADRPGPRRKPKPAERKRPVKPERDTPPDKDRDGGHIDEYA